MTAGRESGLAVETTNQGKDKRIRNMLRIPFDVYVKEKREKMVVVLFLWNQKKRRTLGNNE